jgi:hypothetical protein
MRYVYAAIAFIGVVTLVFASLVALQRMLGGCLDRPAPRRGSRAHALFWTAAGEVAADGRTHQANSQMRQPALSMPEDFWPLTRYSL